MAELTIYRGVGQTEIATVNIDEKTIYKHKVMEIATITAYYVVAAALPIQIGDYVIHKQQKYFLNRLPSIDKENEKSNTYKAIFDSDLYELQNKKFISVDGLFQFNEVGTASTFLTLIVNQINEISSGWQVGVVDDSNSINLDFVDENCYEVLQKVADAFAFEFEVVNKTINFKKAIGTVKNITFEYGKNKGLYSIKRKQLDSQAVITRVYGFGGTKNIDYSYRNRAKHLVFEEKKLEKNIALFGVREAVFYDESIYPQRTAALTDVNIVFNAEKFNETDSWIEDTALDFNINDFLLEGQTAKVVFKSGDLQGVEFEIWKADFDTKRIYIKAFQDTDDYMLPSTSKQARIGDTYTLVDLKMPPSYILAKEAELKASTQAYLDKHSVPKTLYEITIDPKYIKNNAYAIAAADLVKVKDVTLGIDKNIRIQEEKYPLVNPNKITALVADYIPYKLQELAGKKATKSLNQIQVLNNNVSKVTTIQKSSTTINNYGSNASLNTIVINNIEFYHIKAYDNSVTALLEIGDVIFGNFWDRYTLVKAWRYLGGNPASKNSWVQAEGIDFTPFDEETSIPEEITPIEEVYINEKAFKIAKGFNNEDVQSLEVGDIIYGNFWQDKIYVKAWEYIGGATSNRNNWIEHDTSDTTIIS